MLHLTYTGPYAGDPMCGIARGIETDRYQHLGYSLAEWKRQRDDELCPRCRRVSGIVGLISRAERRSHHGRA